MTADAVGGVWSYAIDLAAGLVEHGLDVTLAVLGPPPRADQLPSPMPGLAVVETGLPLDWLAETAAALDDVEHALADLAVEYEADLVHLNSPAFCANRSFGVPVVGVCHSCMATWWAAVRGGDLPADFVWRRDQLARSYAACTRLIAPSRAFAAATARFLWRPADRRPERSRATPGSFCLQGGVHFILRTTLGSGQEYCCVGSRGGADARTDTRRRTTIGSGWR